jgi:uncharacterized protein DUF3309
MSLLWLVLIVVLVIAVLGGMPGLTSHNYGWGPSGIGAILVVILIIALLTGRL